VDQDDDTVEEEDAEEEDQEDNDDDISIESYIPSELRSAVRPYYGDFCYSFSFHPQLMVQLMAEGFLPIAGSVNTATSSSSSSSSSLSRRHVLLPKLHLRRCVIQLAATSSSSSSSSSPTATALLTAPPAAARSHLNSQEHPHKKRPRQQTPPPTSPSTLPPPSDSFFRVHKSTRKRSGKYSISCNRAWHHVVEQCRAQHGRSSWLYPPLVDALTTLFEHSHHRRDMNHPFATVRSNVGEDDDTGMIHVPVRLYSIEVWRNVVEVDDDDDDDDDEEKDKGEEDGKKHYGAAVASSLPSPGTLPEEPQRKQPPQHPSSRVTDDRHRRHRCRRRELVAGELGYTVGAIYTSLTGFTSESGAGTVQLAALGRWLQRSGFQMWDLGMQMDYKAEMGAVLLPRRTFVKAVRTLRRPPHGDLVLSGASREGGDDEVVMNCRDVIDNNTIRRNASRTG
jgi:Leu/Phe-tRNA-protein transferase